jgi:plasmid maintenance system killer protein
VIKSFRHRGVQKFFRTGSKAGIQPKHAGKLRLQPFALDNARQPGDLNARAGSCIGWLANSRITGRSTSAGTGV